MAEKFNIRLEQGELRDGTKKSIRLFYYYVTPTGAEIPLTRCPFVKKIYSRPEQSFEGGTRKNITEYEVRGVIRLKMINLCSTFGKPREVANVYIDIDEDMETIELKGLSNFGGFRGRGRVDAGRSIYTRRPLGDIELDRQALKDLFGMKVLQPPKNMAKGARRMFI